MFLSPSRLIVIFIENFFKTEIIHSLIIVQLVITAYDGTLIMLPSLCNSLK